MKIGRTTWKTIAARLGVDEKELIRRCNRLLAREKGMTAPGWLYGYKSPRSKRR
jgi:DNA-binding Lrp family transcriptional regulator